jgi:hypothetical protein
MDQIKYPDYMNYKDFGSADYAYVCGQQYIVAKLASVMKEQNGHIQPA